MDACLHGEAVLSTVHFAPIATMPAVNDGSGLRNPLHRVTSIPVEPPGPVAGHELQKGWHPAWVQRHVLKSRATTQKSLGATSGGQRGLAMPNHSGLQHTVFIRAQAWGLPEQAFLIDLNAQGDLEIPNIMLVAEEQFLGTLVAGEGRGTSQKEQRGVC